MIKAADWVIDLGPEGGERGGYVVAAGTPEAIARAERHRHRTVFEEGDLVRPSAKMSLGAGGHECPRHMVVRACQAASQCPPG